MATAASPPPPDNSSSSSSSPAPATQRKRDFPTPLLRSFLKSRILALPEVTSAVWDRDAAALTATKADEWAAAVRARMVDLEPQGWKYFVQVSVSERPAGASSAPTVPAGRAVLSTFWDPASDVCVSEVFQNDTVVVTILAVAIRIQY
ncbi:hypothetical protein JCM10207_009098 [Rhodosporidiobolus poonsookiae]